MNASNPDTTARLCRWFDRGEARTNLRHGYPALLQVDNLGSRQHWTVSPVEGGYAVTEELYGGRFGTSVRIDATFGPDAEHWECNCDEFRFANGRKSRAGCLHCKVVHAAVKKLNLSK